jgi:hypothetical protein
VKCPYAFPEILNVPPPVDEHTFALAMKVYDIVRDEPEAAVILGIVHEALIVKKINC